MAGVNFLTAKTILFFHKKEHKSYQFDLKVGQEIPDNAKTATYIHLRRKSFEEDDPIA